MSNEALLIIGVITYLVFTVVMAAIVYSALLSDDEQRAEREKEKAFSVVDLNALNAASIEQLHTEQSNND